MATISGSADPLSATFSALADPTRRAILARLVDGEAPGMTSHVCQIDLRVGGRRFIGMRSPDGQEYHTTGVYREILPLERLVATESPSDASGPALPPSRYGMPEGVSMETIVTVTLEDLDGGRTKVTLNQAGFPSEDWAAGAGRGWNEALDKLVAVLADA